MLNLKKIAGACCHLWKMIFLGISNGTLMPEVRHLHMEMLLLLC